MTLALNGMRASSVSLLTPWTGKWAADVEIDLGELQDLPTGPATLIINKSSLLGTIDPVQSGRFGPRARARVVGGLGWEKIVAPRQYHNDGGVLSVAVLPTTAAEVGERVVETLPSRFGIDFIREAGPASTVLAGLPWFVDMTGTTIVGPRVPKPAPPTLDVLSWDARTKVATLGTDELVTPGTILTDTRFGTAKIRDVEQTWGDGGARATAWTIGVNETPSPEGPGGPELVALIGAIARKAAGSTYLAAVRYRVLSQLPDGRFVLQAVKKKQGLPDLKAISLAPAIPGMSVKVPPGTILHVVFVGGDRSVPVVVRFEKGTMPIEVTIDGLHFHVGSGVGPRVGPVALSVGVASAIGAVVTALNGFPATAPAGAALATALTPLLATIPSTKLFSE